MRTSLMKGFAALAAGLIALGGAPGIGATTWAAPAPSMQAVDAPDQLIFKDGRIIEGKVLEETATHVKFLVVVAGISGEQTYSKADILAIERGEATGGEAEKADATVDARSGEGPDHPVAADAVDESAPGVYVVELEGYYGRDVAPTPLRQIIKDAAANKPQYLILVVDNAWETFSGQEFDDTVQMFDQLFLTEDIEPVFTKELPEILGYTPKIVVWVKNAMGGAAFLPFNFDTIYFAPDGRMGGIGNLLEMFGSTGDERVREKQFSLRLGHARGMANRGGYDGRIVEAMARSDYVLSYRIENGRPVLSEGLPKTELGEKLLTDDGQGENVDSDEERARGLGNDTLTLTADVARDLGISDGTVDSIEDLLWELQIERRHRMIEGRSERILEQWTGSIESAERQLRDLLEEFARIQVQGERRERVTARATQMRKIQEMIALLTKYQEVIKVGMFRLPEGMPDIPSLQVMHEQIKQEQMKDRP